MKIVINKCHGGFGLSDAAYEKLIEWGIPVAKYTSVFSHKSEVIFDNTLVSKEERTSSQYRYWEVWLSQQRTHPLLIRAVEELGPAASGPYAELKIVEIPDGVSFVIDEYDGYETVHEAHRSWG